MVVIVVVVFVAVVVPVPAVVVFKPATISVPVARIILLSIVVRFNPSSTFIRRPRPVAFMPLIVVADRIPVTAYPRVLRAGASGRNANHTGARRGANSDTERNLSL
jgi:hypothetical protein